MKIALALCGLLVYYRTTETNTNMEPTMYTTYEDAAEATITQAQAIRELKRSQAKGNPEGNI